MIPIICNNIYISCAQKANQTCTWTSIMILETISPNLLIFQTYSYMKRLPCTIRVLTVMRRGKSLRWKGSIVNENGQTDSLDATPLFGGVKHAATPAYGVVCNPYTRKILKMQFTKNVCSAFAIWNTNSNHDLLSIKLFCSCVYPSFKHFVICIIKLLLFLY